MAAARRAVEPPPGGVQDSLIAAVIAKLPAEGKPFPGEARGNWLRMMAMALDVAYGVAEDMPSFLPPRPMLAGAAVAAAIDPARAPRPRQAHAGHSFYIGKDGTACNADGEPVLASDVPGDEMIFDYRPISGDFRDLDTIVWADGQRGMNGVAPGISFCGPG